MTICLIRASYRYCVITWRETVKFLHEISFVRQKVVMKQKHFSVLAVVDEAMQENGQIRQRNHIQQNCCQIHCALSRLINLNSAEDSRKRTVHFEIRTNIDFNWMSNQSAWDTCQHQHGHYVSTLGIHSLLLTAFNSIKNWYIGHDLPFLFTLPTGLA